MFLKKFLKFPKSELRASYNIDSYKKVCRGEYTTLFFIRNSFIRNSVLRSLRSKLVKKLSVFDPK